MRLLIDTHLLLWAASGNARLPARARALMEDPASALHVSVASLWEIAIKHGLGRDDFRVDPVRLHGGLLENGYAILPIGAPHVLAAGALPHHHKDPFDRILVAQAAAEGMSLLTSDAALARYGSPMIQV